MRSIPASLKTLLSRGLLALALLLGQQEATLHWLSHAIEATQAKASQTPAADHCDECLSLAGLGAGATSGAPTLAAALAVHAQIAASVITTAALVPRRQVQSRAPPIQA